MGYLAAIMAFTTFASSHSAPAVCLWEPVLQVAAGSEVAARISVALSRRCLAELAFSDSSFLPITWSFESLGCMGPETATIVLPSGVPNGDAYITW